MHPLGHPSPTALQTGRSGRPGGRLDFQKVNNFGINLDKLLAPAAPHRFADVDGCKELKNAFFIYCIFYLSALRKKNTERKKAFF